MSGAAAGAAGERCARQCLTEPDVTAAWSAGVDLQDRSPGDSPADEDEPLEEESAADFTQVNLVGRKTAEASDEVCLKKGAVHISPCFR